MPTFERILPLGTEVRVRSCYYSPPQRATSPHRRESCLLSESKRDHVQVRDQLKMPDIGCADSVAEFQGTRPDQQIR